MPTSSRNCLITMSFLLFISRKNQNVLIEKSSTDSTTTTMAFLVGLWTSDVDWMVRYGLANWGVAVDVWWTIYEVSRFYSIRLPILKVVKLKKTKNHWKNLLIILRLTSLNSSTKISRPQSRTVPAGKISAFCKIFKIALLMLSTVGEAWNKWFFLHRKKVRGEKRARHHTFRRNRRARHLSNQHIVSPPYRVPVYAGLFMVEVNSQRINYVIINHSPMIYCLDYCLIKLNGDVCRQRTHTMA